MHLRHQLAAYSPVNARSVTAAVFTTLTRARHSGELAALVRREYSAQQVLLVDSGTHALELALRIAAERVGGTPTVAIPAFSCFDMATAVVGADARVAVYDMNPATLGPDEASLDAVLAAGARVAVIAPLYGVPVNWEALEMVAARHGALLIEDAAQGHGASWRGKPLGTLSPISILSFGRGKGWTGGRGGAVLLRGEHAGSTPTLAVASFAANAVNVVGLGAQWVLGRPSIYGIPSAIPSLALGETRYHPPTPVMAIPESAASALLSSREAAQREADTRRTVASDLRSRLAAVTNRLVTVDAPTGGVTGDLRLPIRVRGGMAAFADPSVALRCGIAPSYPRILPDLPVIAPRMVGAPGSWPGARELVRDLITAPTHSRLSVAERAAIARLVADAASRG